MTLTENSKGDVSGSSWITLGGQPQYYANFSLTGQVSNGTFSFQETGITSENPPPGGSWCIKSGTLTLSGKTLSGDWQAPYCNPGTLSLNKVGDGTRILFNDPNGTQTDITGKTVKVVVGQQIALTTTPPPGANQTQQWTADGNPIGSYNLVAQTGDTSPPPCAEVTNPTSGCAEVSAPTLDNTYTTLYWTSPGTYNVTYSYTESDGTVKSAQSSFIVEGPKDVKLDALLSTVQLINNTSGTYPAYQKAWYLSCGNVDVMPCITFEASASSSPSGKFQWVQTLIESLNEFTYSNGKVKHCNRPSGLDNQYPYDYKTGFSPTTSDSPNGELDPKSLVSYAKVFKATMYLEWQSDSPNSIPVPLGYVNWRWTGLTEQSSVGGPWALSASSGPFASKFIRSTSYPTWTIVDLNSMCYE